MSHLLGIDIGTQGVKAALYTPQGRCVGEAFEPSRLHRPEPGVVEEDPEFHVASVCRMVRSCLEKAGGCEVAAMAITGQMAGVIGIDRQGVAVTPYDSWLDKRCGPQIVAMAERAGEQVLRATGNAPSFNHGPKILWWRKERPAEYARIASFVQPAGYVAMRLCERTEAFLDATYLHFSGFADNRSATWDEGLCQRFGIEPERLPQVVQPTEIVGELSRRMAAECGLRAGTPVVAGCGDTAASFLSCGATEAGVCVDVAGTASIFAATLGGFAPDIHGGTLGCGRAATPGLWHAYAYINGGGMNLEWFRREMLGSSHTFEHLNALAAGVAPRDDLPLFIPHLGGRVSPADPDLRGAWVGLTWEHSRADLYRAVLESVALEYAVYRKALRRLWPDAALSDLRITGGGEKSELWNQMKADVLGIPIVQIQEGGGAPMGVALLAGVGAGILPGVREAAAGWVCLGRTYEPQREHAEYFAGRLERYESLLQALSDWGRREP
jgi:xylulokinase